MSWDISLRLLNVPIVCCCARFNVSMVIRTYYMKGLLFYISNVGESAFIAVQLVDDQVSVVYSSDMRAVTAINSNAHVSDGAWHTVSQLASLSSLLKLVIFHFYYCICTEDADIL